MCCISCRVVLNALLCALQQKDFSRRPKPPREVQKIVGKTFPGARTTEV